MPSEEKPSLSSKLKEARTELRSSRKRERVLLARRPSRAELRPSDNSKLVSSTLIKRLSKFFNKKKLLVEQPKKSQKKTNEYTYLNNDIFIHCF